MKALLVGASSIAGIENFGDLLLADIYESWIEEAVPGIEVSRLEYRGFLKSRDAIEQATGRADFVVFNGGGYFGEKPFKANNPLKAYALKQAWGIRNDDLYGSSFRAARRRGKPVLISGVEAGPISSPLFRRTVRGLFDHASFCSVRNVESHRFLGEIGCRSDRIHVAPDSALSICRNERLDGENAIRMTGDAAQAIRIGLHVHKLIEPQQEIKVARIVRDISARLGGRPVEVFYVHDQRKNGVYHERSLDAERRIRSVLSDLNVIEFYSASQLIGDLHALHLLVTTKLHCGIVARALGIPVLSIPTHTKTARFYSYLNESYRCQPVNIFAEGGVPQLVIDEVEAAIAGKWSQVGDGYLDMVRESHDRFVAAVREVSRRV